MENKETEEMTAKEINNISVRDGDSWSAGRAASVQFDVSHEGEVKHVKFSNVWDTDIPHIQEWREAKQNVNPDFSGVTLETPPEEIEKMRKDLLLKYPEVKDKEIKDLYVQYGKAQDKSYAESDVEYFCHMAVNALYGASLDAEKNPDMYDKVYQYVGQMAQCKISQHEARTNRDRKGDSPFDLENPYRTRMDRLLGRDRYDPLRMLKEATVVDHKEFLPLYAEGLHKVLEVLPKTAEEMRALTPEERVDFAKVHFGEQFTGYDETCQAANVLLGALVQQATRVMVETRFVENFATRVDTLTKEKRREDYKARMSGRELSGVVIADDIAKVLAAEDEALRVRNEVLGTDEKRPMMTPERGKEMATLIREKRNRG